MTIRLRGDEPERPVDLTSLAEDDVLLDQLGRGEIVTDAGEVEAMLSDWRASLPAPRPVDRRLLAVTTRPPRARRVVRVALGAVVAVAFAGGGVTAAAANAGPDSPLWPVTRIMYRDLAESRLAEQEAGRAVTDAEDALNHGQLDQASRLLEQAASRIQAINDPGMVDDLRTRLDEIRAQLSASGKVEVPPTPPKTSSSKIPPSTAREAAPTPTPPSTTPPAATPTPTPLPGPPVPQPDYSNPPTEPPESGRPSTPVELPPVPSSKRGNR